MTSTESSMRRLRLKLVIGGLFCALSNAQAAVCPDPLTSSLRWGEIPAPWALSPFSDNRPQGYMDTQFKRATILVMGLGRGVACYYQNASGFYSIWWDVSVKIPGRGDNNWRDSLAGFDCTESIGVCNFYTATLDYRSPLHA